MYNTPVMAVFVCLLSNFSVNVYMSFLEVPGNIAFHEYPFNKEAVDMISLYIQVQLI